MTKDIDTPEPAWIPDEKTIAATHIAAFMQEKGFTDYLAFQHWTATHYVEFWETMIKKLHIIFTQPFQQLVDLSTGVETPHWFPGATLNIVNSCFQADDNHTAIISQSEQGELKKIGYGELNRLSNRIANSIQSTLHKGDHVAIIMPMTIEAVAIYLGIIKAGCVVVSIPESFSAEEITTRLRITNVKMIFLPR